MVGYKSVWNPGAKKKIRRYWHYAISADARLAPQPVIILNAHVLFSNDGKTVWDSARRLHSARRTLGGGWWNDDWRDRLLAAASWIASDGDEIQLPVSASESITVNRAPLTFDSSLSYRDKFARHAEPHETAFDDPDLEAPVDETSDNSQGVLDA